MATCLESLARLDYSPDRFEVIVVDDGSREPPAAAVDDAARSMDVTLVRLDRNSGPGAARNAGVARATGDYVAFLGDDCEPAPDWLRALARRFEGCDECLVGGRIVNGLPGNPFSTASDRLIGYLYSHYNRDPEHAGFFTPNNMAAGRTRFTGTGGFDAAIGLTGEDRELCDRWLHAGGRIVYAPDAVVRHTHPLGFGSFWRQQVGYGRGTRKYRQRQRQPRGGSVAPEPLSFYLNLVLFPLQTSRGMRAWSSAGLLALAQAATATGFFLEAIREFWGSRKQLR